MTAGRSAAKYLWDAQRAAERMTRLTAGRRFDDHLAHGMFRAVVERQLEVVGGAFAGPRRADPALAAAIPDLPRIVAIRDILIHGYATVGDRLVWARWSATWPGYGRPSRGCSARGGDLGKHPRV